MFLNLLKRKTQVRHPQNQDVCKAHDNLMALTNIYKNSNVNKHC